MEAAEKANIPLDHYHIDFGMHDVEADGASEQRLDYGRILRVEEYIQERGLSAGFIAANAFSSMETEARAAEDPKPACESAAERTQRYFEGYRQAGGHSDYLILQRWQPHPAELGENEDTPLSQLAILKSIVSVVENP